MLFLLRDKLIDIWPIGKTIWRLVKMMLENLMAQGFSKFRKLLITMKFMKIKSVEAKKSMIQWFESYEKHKKTQNRVRIANIS